jgi:hypothetical protein
MPYLAEDRTIVSTTGAAHSFDGLFHKRWLFQEMIPCV